MSHPPAEVHTTAADVDRLLAAQHPRLRAPVRLVSHGWDNDMFRLGDDLAVRLPRRAAAAQLIAHEQRWLPELSAVLPVRVPAPVAVGVPDGSFPWHWSVVPWLPGERATDVDAAARDVVAEQLAGFLNALHRPAPADAPTNPYRGVPLTARAEAVDARMRQHPALAAVWQTALAAPEWSGDALWAHGDLHLGNLLLQDGALAAVLDFGDVCAGDPACDLAVAWYAFTSAGRARFRSALSPVHDDAMWQRSRGWAAAIATLLADSGDRGLARMAAHTAAQLVA